MPSNTENKTTKKAKPVPGVSISLTDEVLDNFTEVKQFLLRVAPGIRPTNADVARYAFHLAAEACNLRPVAGGFEHSITSMDPVIYKSMSEGVIGD
jgi:hypothetical protein